MLELSLVISVSAEITDMIDLDLHRRLTVICLAMATRVRFVEAATAFLSIKKVGYIYI